MNKQLLAFKNEPKIKEKLLIQLQNHYDADEIIKGQYWEGGKGCAVGCTVHSDSHYCYELELGIPMWVAYLEDTLFEGMPNKDAKEFPLKLIKAIPTGFSNWQHIYHKLCIHILEKECKNTDHPLVKQAICDIITLHKGESLDKAAWGDAYSAAYSAAEFAAESAAWSAAHCAAESAAHCAYSADSAAGSAAYSAARSARSAAYSAAHCAAEFAADHAADRAADRAYSAESAAYLSIANKLIQLLEVENK